MPAAKKDPNVWEGEYVSPKAKDAMAGKPVVLPIPQEEQQPEPKVEEKTD